MPFHFTCHGHPNILATHARTLEFTKDEELTLRGDCIVGVGADFDAAALKEFIKDKRRLRCAMRCGDVLETFSFDINPDFNDNHEIVIRLSGFMSGRTLGTNATKTSLTLSRALIERTKDINARIDIMFYEEKDTE